MPSPLPNTSVTGAESAVHARRVLVCASVLGLSADLLLRDEPWGIGLGAWMATLAAGVIGLARLRPERLSRESRLWLGLAVLCAFLLAWRDAPMLHVFNVLGGLAALTLFVLSHAAIPVSGLGVARVRDLVQSAVGTVRGVAGGAIPLVLREAALQETRRWGNVRACRLGRAAVIAGPVLLLFATLLTRADPVFASYLRLPDWRLDEVLSHLIISGFFAWIAAGWMRRALLERAHRNAEPEWPLPLALGVTDLVMLLGGLCLIFAAFVAVQVGWLFGGEGLVLRTTGLTYAAYARRGFAELTMVSVLLLPLLLVVGALVPNADTRGRQLYRGLSAILLVLLGVIIISAFARMQLYVRFYGISLDRLYATAFMAWFAVVSTWLGVTVLRERPRGFATGAVASGFAILLGLNAMGPDAWVTRQHLNRAADASSPAMGLDWPYVASLGGDAVPTVVGAMLRPQAAGAVADGETRCRAAAALLERWTGTSTERFTRRWTQWNLGRRHAMDAVRAREAELRALACPAALPGHLRP
ncbi:MAG: DUF4173 domain-containing protein [Gemmatimonadetes bacterium]|nr:DUF4173 domain-containing protein [Gemmatimonadota bacterium]